MPEKISADTLHGVAETLLIPLAARALLPHRLPRSRYDDPEARRIAKQLDADLTRFQSDRASMESAVARSDWIDRRAAAFFMAHPGGCGVSLGSGLDTRLARLARITDMARAEWIDLDLPEVTALRRQLIPDTDSSRSIAADLNGTDWSRVLDAAADRPLIVTCEGVSMYMTPERVEALFETIARCRGASRASTEIIFDYCSPMMARLGRHHVSVRKTSCGRSDASPFQSSMRRAADIAAFDPRWRIDEETDGPARSGAVGTVIATMHRVMTGRMVYGLARATLV